MVLRLGLHDQAAQSNRDAQQLKQWHFGPGGKRGEIGRGQNTRRIKPRAFSVDKKVKITYL
jgi:hypothetical protein